MKNRKIMILLLFVLPLLVVMIASDPSSVMVFDGENTAYYSWLQPVSQSPVGWCAPVAALLNYGLFALAVMYGLKKKLWCVKGIRNIAFIAGCLAVLPNLFRLDVQVVPNVFGGIGLLADAVVADMLLKTENKNQRIFTSGKKLDLR